MPARSWRKGRPEELLTDPRHPYTWALLHAAPRMDANESGDRRLITIEGQPPDPRAWPEGCRFRARCPFAIEKCAEHPALLEVAPARQARCWVTQAGGRLAPPERRRPPPPAPVRRDAPGAHAGGARRRQAFRACRAAACSRSGACCARWTASISTSRAARRWGWSANPAAGNPRWRGSIMRLHEPTAGEHRARGARHQPCERARDAAATGGACR